MLYDSKHSFYQYNNISILNNISFESKSITLVLVFHKLNKLKHYDLRKKNISKKKKKKLFIRKLQNCIMSF